MGRDILQIRTGFRIVRRRLLAHLAHNNMNFQRSSIPSQPCIDPTTYSKSVHKTELSMSAAPTPQPKPQRLLACIRCQQRKVKCERKYPCKHCTRAGVQAECAPASLAPRQRKRRFPERYLLERVRQYEDLLQQHNIPFEPLHSSTGHGAAPPEAGHELSVAEEVAKPSADKAAGGVDIWQAMNHAV